MDESKRVVVTKAFHNVVTMQVCAVDDATDEEILEVCNRENPSGTTNGWGEVIRKPNDSLFQAENTAPVKCADHKSRTHFLVLC